MKINSLFQKKKPVISFEFFPPKTDQGLATLQDTIAELKELSPAFVSMTYGAGGSTRAKTVQLVSMIKHKVGIEAMAHLTCVGHTSAELEEILKELEGEGIENVIALRGDPPQGQTTFVPQAKGFRYAADLVRLIRSKFKFSVAVAGYPEKHVESPSLEEDLRHLKEKVEAGGDVIITQLFFNNNAYFSFVEKVRGMGIQAPIVAGIMPITDVDQIKRFTSMCGAVIPADLLAQLEKVSGDKEKVMNVGVEHASRQCLELLQKGAPGIHFYTLNKSQATRNIFLRLKQGGAI